MSCSRSSLIPKEQAGGPSQLKKAAGHLCMSASPTSQVAADTRRRAWLLGMQTLTPLAQLYPVSPRALLITTLLALVLCLKNMQCLWTESAPPICPSGLCNRVCHTVHLSPPPPPHPRSGGILASTGTAMLIPASLPFTLAPYSLGASALFSKSRPQTCSGQSPPPVWTPPRLCARRAWRGGRTHTPHSWSWVKARRPGAPSGVLV